MLKDIFKGVVFGLPIAVTVLDYVGYVARVEGLSMQPSLNPDDSKGEADFVMLNKWATRNYDIERGDIVSLISPRDPGSHMIKRVIALEGDIVKTHNNNKKKYIRIPEGKCWVEGDNHGRSMDSNYFGPVSINMITAKASHIVWPLNRLQRLENDQSYLVNRVIKTRP